MLSVKINRRNCLVSKLLTHSKSKKSVFKGFTNILVSHMKICFGWIKHNEESAFLACWQEDSEDYASVATNRFIVALHDSLPRNKLIWLLEVKWKSCIQMLMSNPIFPYFLPKVPNETFRSSDVTSCHTIKVSLLTFAPSVDDAHFFTQSLHAIRDFFHWNVWVIIKWLHKIPKLFFSRFGGTWNEINYSQWNSPFSPSPFATPKRECVWVSNRIVSI